MRPLIINDHGIFGGGTETRIRVFVEQLIRKNLVKEVHILQKFSDVRKENNYKSQEIFFHTLSKGESAYKVARQIIKKHSIDLVQAHNLLSIKPYCLLPAKQAKIPIVWWAHDYWLLCAKRSFIDPYHASQETLCPKAAGLSCHRCMGIKTRMKYLFWERIMNLCNIALAPSMILKEIHEKEKILVGKWRIIIPWIDPLYQLETDYGKHFLLMKEKDEKVLLFVGSLIEFKGAWVAARALKFIVQKFPKTILIFVGNEQEPTSRYRQEIEQQCINDGTLNNILFLGKKNKEEILELYKETDVYLCPTVCMESFGLNWAEAMAFGLPVVAGAIGSIPEYIQNKKTGLLFPPRNYEALGRAVIALLANQKYAQRIADAGKIYAQRNFTGERAAAEIHKLYTTLLHNFIAKKRKE